MGYSDLTPTPIIVDAVPKMEIESYLNSGPLSALVPKTNIVDDLATDDATKVLSAKQGKILSDQLAAQQADYMQHVDSINAGILALQDDANNLQSQVTSLSSGAPKAVTAVAEMTDTAKNYVYTGLENGYTAGNWYYYNGSAWMSGGIYQSTGIANETVKVNTIQSTLLSSTSSKTELRQIFELGTLNSSGNGEESASTTRIRSIGYIVANGDVELVPLNNASYKYAVIQYDLGSVYKLTSDWVTANIPFTMYSGYKYRIVIAKQDDDSTITNVAEAANSIVIFKKQYSANDYNLHALNNYNNITNRYYPLWALGTINSGASASTQVMSLFSATRFQTPALMFAGENCSLVNLNPSLYKCIVFCYSSDGTYLSSTGWKSQEFVKISSGSYYRLLIAYIADTIMYKGNGYVQGVMENLINNFMLLGGDVRNTKTNISMLNNISETPYSFVHGNIYANTSNKVDGEPEISESIITRVVTADIHYAENDIVILNPNLYRICVWYYNSLGNYLGFHNSIYNHTNTTWIDGVSSLKIKKGSYFRLHFAYADNTAIVNVNDIRITAYTILKPVATSKFIDVDYMPGYWVEHLNSKIDAINGNMLANPLSSFSFAMIADTHWNNNNAISPALIKKIMQECNLVYLLGGGDFIGGNEPDKNSSLSNMRNTVKVFSNASKIFLPTVGNHDRRDDNSITNTEIHSILYRHLHNLVSFGPDGMYYYYDDMFSKIRIISLNSMDDTVLENPTSCTIAYRQAQLNWLANIALNVPDGSWSVLILTHVPPYADFTGNSMAPVNSEIMMGVLESFKNKASYVVSGGSGDYAYNISADFSGDGGDVICVLTGHCHYDQCRMWNGNILVMSILDDGLHQVTGAPTRTVGTITEQAFDVITVDKSNRKLYCTRIGAGSDREYNY